MEKMFWLDMPRVPVPGTASTVMLSVMLLLKAFEKIAAAAFQAPWAAAALGPKFVLKAAVNVGLNISEPNAGVAPRHRIPTRQYLTFIAIPPWLDSIRLRIP